MKYTFHPHAEKDSTRLKIITTIISEELGDRFREDIETTISRIRKFPRAYQLVSRIHRRCRLSDFPYGIVYRLKPNEIRVLAVMHLHREQDYWIHRT